jgi:tetratricopeptide (TPR) repeat protein
VGTALGNLGNCLARQGRAAQALPLQQRSLAILEHTLGTQHPSVARTLYNLGKLMTELERYDDARETLERGLAIAASLADDDDSLFEWYKQLGDLALAQGEPAEARMHFQKGLDIRTKHGAAAYVLAPYEFDIANTWAQEDPARARAGVRQAREHAVLWAEDATGREAERATELIGKIDEWLSAHAG